MATIHPHKGYLNTEFQLLSQKGGPLSYSIKSKESATTISEGILSPNEPKRVKMPMAGSYEVIFGDGRASDIMVQDGYKFGGGEHKASFLFDDCPWVFVVMHDRTYFHNRVTGEEYVEAISPDSILEVSEDYVILQNQGQDDNTLYSLIDQKPILCATKIIYYNKSFFIWVVDEDEEDAKELVIYSLIDKKEIIRKKYAYLSADKSNEKIHLAYNDHICTISINSDGNFEELSFSPNGVFGAFAQIKYAVFIEKSYGKTELVVYDLDNQSEKNRIQTNGSIARINNNEIININKRIQSILDFNISTTEFPKAIITAEYYEYDVYPCEQDTFYKEKMSKLTTITRKIETYCKLKSANTDYCEDIGYCDNVFIDQCRFIIYGYNESIVIPLNYRGYSEHKQNGRIYRHKSEFILSYKDSFYNLNKNGFWEDRFLGDYDYSYFEDFGVIRNIKTGEMLNGELGIFKCYFNLKKQIVTDKYIIFANGDKLKTQCFDHIPSVFSPSLKYGLDVNKKEILLYNRATYYSESKKILFDIYDTSEYRNVFLSENGHQIMHRNNDVYTMMDINSGDTTIFDNLSFVEHINGARPQFRINDCSQAILINPINGLPIDTKLLNEYHFVSPNGELYADKELDKYVEYYDHIQQRIISKDQYLEYVQLTSDNAKFHDRKVFVQKHSEFFVNALRKKGYRERPIQEFHEILLNERKYDGTSLLLDLFIEKKGIAVIRKTKDKSEVSRINLGMPLWFLNYVSFSYDNRYVAMAGRYPNNSGYSGLFLIYDLFNSTIVIDSKSSYAVWTTAFTKEGAVAAYTSNPNTFFANSPKAYNKATSDEQRIDHYNFLSFSPDGKYLACSQQGYLSHKKPDGSVRSNWGHQLSSIVSIRNVKNPIDEIMVFSDLSDEGIAGTSSGKSVASVSFSNDNGRLMMVGRDGCIIVRNLHI